MMIRILLIFLALVTAAFLAAPLAHAFETRATSAYVIDQTTGTVLLSKNGSQPMPPASMSKLMTLYMAFEALGDGRLSLNEELRVSQTAMDYGGSTLFLRAGERVRVEDLLRGIIVLSGNDACVVIAEALSPDGTEAGFARLMTQRAKQLGMSRSNFTNSNGWPQAGHLMSAQDLAILTDRLISDFPQYYPLFAEREFLFDEKEAANRYNRNPLLGLGIGADGLKTGHTEEAGYGLVGSAKQGDRRIIFVLSGLETAAARATESESIVNWAFRQFSQRDLGAAGTEIGRADVWMGEAGDVGLVLEEDLSILLPILSGDAVQAEVVYDGPIEAPIQKGQALAELVVKPDGLPERRVDLVAAEAVGPAGFLVRVTTVAQIVARQINQSAQNAAAPAPEATQ